MHVYKAMLSAALMSLCVSMPIPAVAQTSAEERIEPREKQLAILRSLTPLHFAQTSAVHDDDLETTAVITTQPGYRDRGGFTDRVRSDNFLRAFIDKRTRSVRFQVYQTLTYSGSWRQFRSVNYATSKGPVSAPVDELAHDIEGCYSGLCSFTDTLGFDVPESTLRALADQYVTGKSPFWRFRFQAKNGVNWEDRMLPAEAAGLLMKVDAYISSRTEPAK